MNNTILLSIKCFHEHNQFQYDYNISACKYLWTDDDQCFHVINLKVPVSSYDLIKLPTVKYHYNTNNQIDELWELVSIVPRSSLYNIDRLSSMNIIVNLATQMTQSICNITICNMYYKLFNTRKNSSSFLQNIASFTMDQQNNPIYIHLNRECLQNLQTTTTEKMIKKKLIHQLEYFTEIIKVLFFTSNRKKNQKNPYICSTNCKLSILMPRFINDNDINTNTFFMEKFHEGYCNYTKLELFEFLGVLFPEAKQAVSQSLSHVMMLA